MTGEELSERLKVLAIGIEIHNNAAAKFLAGWVNHAREAGNELLEAKRRLGHKTKWSKWRYRNLIDPGIMSKSTSLIYMKIACNWDDVRLVEARQKGVQLESIRAVLRVLNGEAPPAPDARDSRPGETEDEYWDRRAVYDASEEGRKRRRKERAEVMRKQIRREFATRVRELDDDELRVLFEIFEPSSWDKLYADLRNTVCVIYGDHYGEDEELDRVVNEKIKHASNSKGMRRAKGR